MPGMDVNGLAGLQQVDGGDGSNNQGVNVGGGVDANALLAQQQALMAMASGGGAGMDAGASRDALMNLLAKQGFGGGAGQGMPMPQMGMMGGMGAMNGMQMGAMNAMGQMGVMNGMNGLQNQGGNQADSSNNGGGDNINANQNIMANPAFSGFAPAMGGFQAGFPMGMGEFQQ